MDRRPPRPVKGKQRAAAESEEPIELYQDDLPYETFEDEDAIIGIEENSRQRPPPLPRTTTTRPPHKGSAEVIEAGNDRPQIAILKTPDPAEDLYNKMCSLRRKVS